MEEKINQALVQLENDLQSLVSARKQVEETIKASSELQKVVGGYVASVRTLCAGLQSWEDDLKVRELSLGQETGAAIADIKRLCAETITSFSGKANDIETSFKNNTKETLDSFTEQNSKLAERVIEMNALREQIKTATAEIENVKSSLEMISKDLKDSQDEQDRILEEIKHKIFDLPSTIQQSTSAITQAVSFTEESLKEVLGQANKALDAVNGKADTLSLNIANLTSLCQEINSSVASTSDKLSIEINKTKDELKSDYLSTKEDIAKSTNINRWIMIAGFIILALLHFLLR